VLTADEILRKAADPRIVRDNLVVSRMSAAEKLGASAYFKQK
jgi:hypothetical protein